MRISSYIIVACPLNNESSTIMYIYVDYNYVIIIA